MRALHDLAWTAGYKVSDRWRPVSLVTGHDVLQQQTPVAALPSDKGSATIPAVRGSHVRRGLAGVASLMPAKARSSEQLQRRLLAGRAGVPPAAQDIAPPGGCEPAPAATPCGRFAPAEFSAIAPVLVRVRQISKTALQHSGVIPDGLRPRRPALTERARVT